MKIPSALLQRRFARQVPFLQRAARTRRYHTESVLRPQSVGEHSYGVAWLCWALMDEEPSAALLLHALAHDAAEHEVGDIPAPIKRRLNVREVFAAAEQLSLTEAALELPPLSDMEEVVLKWADCFEGAFYCVHEAELGNRTLRPVLLRFIAYLRELGVERHARAAALFQLLLDTMPGGTQQHLLLGDTDD